MMLAPTHPPHHDGNSTAWPDVTQNGAVIGKSQRNGEAAFLRLKTAMFHDAFNHLLMIESNGDARELSDVEINRLYFECDSLGWKPPKPWFVDFVSNLAHADSRNGVRDWLLSLKWDGVKRLDGWLVRHAGGENTPFARAAFKHHMLAAAARILTPGVKADQILVMEGPQGGGKSTFLVILAGERQHTDALSAGASDKETLEITAGKIIVELGELAGLRKRDVNDLKVFASRTADRARLAYGRMPVEVRRQFTLWATTNESEYLDDPTGNRRFWPVKVKRIDLDQARKDREQLWAEAVDLVRGGHPLPLPNALWSEAATNQSDRVVGDVWEDELQIKLAPFDGREIKVVTLDVLKALGITTDKTTGRQEQMRVGRAMQRLGFESARMGKHRCRGWCRGSSTTAVRLEVPLLKGSFEIGGAE